LGKHLIYIQQMKLYLMYYSNLLHIHFYFFRIFSSNRTIRAQFTHLHFNLRTSIKKIKVIIREAKKKNSVNLVFFSTLTFSASIISVKKQSESGNWVCTWCSQMYSLSWSLENFLEQMVYSVTKFQNTSKIDNPVSNSVSTKKRKTWSMFWRCS